MKEFHYKWVDRKSKATQERSLVETNLTMGKSTRLLAFFRKTNPGFLRKLEPIHESTKVSSFKEHFSLRAWNDRGGAETEGREDKGTEAAVSVSAPAVPALEDRPVSKSLNLTSKPILSLL